MKTLIFSVLALTLTAFSVNAQDISKNALGLRLGDNDGLGAEISYQRHLNDNNRLEFDLGWRDSDNLDVFKLVGLYQWVMPIDDSFTGTLVLEPDLDLTITGITMGRLH